MRHRMHEGQAHAPRTVIAAEERVVALAAEIDKIDRQLADLGRRRRYPSPTAYQNWRERAQHSRNLFERERDQLRDWLGNEDLRLLRLAVEIQHKLIDDGVEFTEEELKNLERCEKHLRTRDETRA